MDIYGINDINDLLSSNSYPGRGIIAGMSPDGLSAVSAYFIMGRSANSRNRVFVVRNGELYTEPYDPAKVEDPSLIIYPAVRQYKNTLIITNGDHTNTVYDGLLNGKSFYEALEEREFEPDKPNFTPRISAALTFKEGGFDYRMSILKSLDENGTACGRFGFYYPACAGMGHFIHTYLCDGNPVIPSFQGEPERVKISGDIDEFTDKIWKALDENNKISLYVRYTDLNTLEYEHRIVNKNKAVK